MRRSRHSSAAPGTIAMLCAAALFTFACGRNSEEPRTADVKTSPAVEETGPAQPEATPAPAVPPSTVELPAERSVEAREQVAASEQEELEAAIQRDLDQRKAELEAQAREVRERERKLKAAEREIARREEAARREAERPAPQPEPEAVETEEVAPAPAAEPEMAPLPEAPAEEPEPVPRFERVTVESGTTVSVELQERLSSESSRPGEIFRARVTGDVRQDGRVVIPAGSEVVGEVTEAVPLRKVGGRAKLAVRFTDLVLPSGSSVPIEASFVGQGKSETGRDAATIGGSAAGGAILGRVLNKGDRSKGAVIGAILGAVIGTAIASRTPGEEVTIDRGAVVDLKLDRPAEVKVRE